jgi:hypothetical protein
MTLLERLEAAESRFDSVSMQINSAPGLKPIWIDRIRFATWKETLQKPHTETTEQLIESELSVFIKRLDAAEENYRLYSGRFR